MLKNKSDREWTGRRESVWRRKCENGRNWHASICLWSDKDQPIDKLMEGWQNDRSGLITEGHLGEWRETKREREESKNRKQREKERGWQSAVMNDNCSSGGHALYVEANTHPVTASSFYMSRLSAHTHTRCSAHPMAPNDMHMQMLTLAWGC